MPEHSLAMSTHSSLHLRLPPLHHSHTQPLHQPTPHTFHLPQHPSTHFTTPVLTLHNHHIVAEHIMLTHLSIVAVPLLVLLGQVVATDLTFKLHTHPRQSGPSPRAFGTGRSRPRRQDSAHNGVDLRSEVHPAIPLNNHDSGGVAYTIVIEVAGTSLPVLVSSTGAVYSVLLLL